MKRSKRKKKKTHQPQPAPVAAHSKELSVPKWRQRAQKLDAMLSYPTATSVAFVKNNPGKAVGGVIVFIGLIASVEQLMGGPFWPTSPEIHPSGPTAAGYTSDLIVKNESSVFWIRDAQPNCKINEVAYMADPEHRGPAMRFKVAPGHEAGRLTEEPFPTHDIKPLGSFGYNCDALPPGPVDEKTGQTRLDLIYSITFTVSMNYRGRFIGWWNPPTESEFITWTRNDKGGGTWREGPIDDDVNTPTGPKFPGAPPNGPPKMGPWRY